MRKSLDNSKTGPNLAFFREFLSETGATNESLAKCLGVSKPMLYHWLATDDVRLSYIEKAAETFGYHLYVSISDNPQDISAFAAKVEKDGMTLSVARLHFLTCAIKEAGMTKMSLATAMGISRDTITYWYKKDDITIKNLVCCAQVLKRNINYKFMKSNLSEHFDRNKILIRSSITTTKEWEVPTCTP